MTETASYDATHYVQRLDLGEDPFAVDFESDYFYTGAMRRQLLDQLVHFSRFGHQTVLLVGATGSGTSTLLDHAYEVIEDAMDCCFINAEETTSPEQLLESLNEQLNFQLPSPVRAADFFAALQSGLIIDGEPEPIMLAVDQAHYLSLEAYCLLHEITDLGDGNICLLIAGEYQVEQMAKLASFNDAEIKLLELEPLSEAETSDYILGLLRSVGYAGDLPLSNDQLVVLHERSGGNLLEINQLVPSLLHVKAAANASTSRFGIPIAHVAAISILAAAVIVSWLYLGSDETPDEVAEPARIDKAVELPSIALVKEEPVAPKAELAPLPEKTKAEASNTLAVSESEMAEVNTGAIDRTIPQSKPEVEAAKPKPVVPKEPELAKPIKEAPIDVVAKASIEPKPAPVSAPAAEPKPKKVEPKLTLPAAKPAPVAAKPSIPIREQRLLAYPESNYVLQLIGSVEEARAREFVKRYINRMPVTYFETRLKGKPWFVVLTGPYEDKSAALAGVKVLPQELQKQRPWARSAASVQKDIRSNRQ